MKFVKREKSIENGVVYTTYDCADMDPMDSVRCTFRVSYKELNYDGELQGFTDIYLNCSVRFASSEIYLLRSVRSMDNLVAIVEPVKSN